MNKRDLLADLEAIREGATLFGYPNPGVNTQCELYEIAEHAIERAIEVEALARELAKKMELMHMAVNALLLGEDVPVEVVDRITLGVSSVLLKAKEVLGDEN
jgi:hypothetical protein